MTGQTFESFAQNGEDVVLWRALRNLPTGRYVEVGANAPVVDSISWPFYRAGWRGMTVEPMADLAAAHRRERPGDRQVEAVVGAGPGPVTFHEVPGTGLSTLDADLAAAHRAAGRDVVEREVPTARLDDLLADAGWEGEPIHFLVVDTEGAEGQVLATLDLTRFRPWVMVVEATAPMSTRPTHQGWEPAVLAAGYELCLFDGLSRFYVAREHREELAASLSFPACVLDGFTSRAHREVLAERDAAAAAAEQARRRADAEAARADELAAEASRWRDAALHRWDDVASARSGPRADDAGEAARMRATVSWRVTRPLRTVRSNAGKILRQR